MLKNLRLKLLRLIIGKTSVIANINISGQAQVNNGLVVNSYFTRKSFQDSLRNTHIFSNSRCDLLFFPTKSSGIIEDCVFDRGDCYYLNQEHGDDAADGLTPQTAKRTLQATEAMVWPGDVVYVAGRETSQDCRVK